MGIASGISRSEVSRICRRRPMAHVISFINLKGGVGKTTTAVAVAELLAGEHYKRVEGRHNLDQGFELAVRPDAGHHGPVAFSLVYLGLCRVLALVVSSRRGAADKDIELVVLRHQVRALKRQATAASGTGPLTAPSWLRSAGCSRGNAGELSWLRPRLCSVGTEKPDAGNGGHGGANEARDGQR
jgi:hypothetical protein